MAHIRTRKNKTNDRESVFLVISGRDAKRGEVYVDWKLLWLLVREFARIEEEKRKTPEFLGKEMISQLVESAASLNFDWETVRKVLGIKR